MYNPIFQFDASTWATPGITQVTYPTPGADVSQYGVVTTSLTSPNLDLQHVQNITVAINTSGSLSGTISVQVSVDKGFGMIAQGVDGLDDLNTRPTIWNQKTNSMVTASAGGLVNWHTIDTLNVTSGSSAFATYTNQVARALRLQFNAGTGPMTGTLGASIGLYGIQGF